MKYAINPYKFSYSALLAAHVGLVWCLSWLPTQDGPVHIYNLVILRDLMNGGKEWGNFFTYKLSPVPNLGFDLISYPLLHFFPPLVVEKIFVSLYILLLGISAPVLLRTFGRNAFPQAYLVFPVVFNFTLLMGFYSYVIAVPLFVLAFSMAWGTRTKPPTRKFVYLNLAGLALFYLHLIPFLFFLISLYAIALAEQSGMKAKMANLTKQTLMISPCVLQLAFYLHEGRRVMVSDFSYLFSKARNAELLRDLLSFSTVNYSPLQGFPAILLLITFLYFLLLFIITKLYEKQPVSTQEKAFIYFLSALMTIYFLAPLHFGGGSFFNQRFPWVIFIISLPLLRTPRSSLLRPFFTTVIAVIIVTNFALTAFLMRQQSAKIANYVSGMDVGLPKGAFVMSYKTKDDWSRIDVLMHAASYYGLLSGCVDVGNYSTSFDYFPVHFKRTLPAFPSPVQIDYEPRSIDWAGYPAIQYLICWEIDAVERKELSRFYRLIRLDQPLSIWARREPARPNGSAISGNHDKLLQVR